MGSLRKQRVKFSDKRDEYIDSGDGILEMVYFFFIVIVVMAMSINHLGASDGQAILVGLIVGTFVLGLLFRQKLR